MTDPINWAAVYKKQAREAESMGNAASGYGFYALANSLWSFAVWLRDKAKKLERDERDHGSEGSPAGQTEGEPG